jgi:glutamate synthase (NADPH/NADH) small chain
MPEKINLNRVSMPKQEPQVRRHNHNEVALGYSMEQALEEAGRCIQCKNAGCIKGCPVDVDIPEFVAAVRDGDIPEAVRILKSKNSLPATCGRVCPQETQCEMTCNLAKKGAPIAIGRLERFVADWELEHKGELGIQVEKAPPTGKRVAVIGSGPSGLTCAADMAKAGHEVTILEALHEPGGVLMYGIPEFRLPKCVVRADVDFVKSLGVEIKLDSVVGRLISVDEILENGYHAVFLGIGAGAPMFLNIPGENLSGIYSANEFLVRINLMKAYLHPEYDTPLKVGKRVVVVGAGNVAMDCARWALRLGAEEVHIVYRRSEAEMPARLEERENAKEEGVIFDLLTNPKQFFGDEQGWVKSMECYKMELGEPDESGRRRPVRIPGSEFIMEVDTVGSALGTIPNPLVPSTTKGLETTKWGTIKTDEETGRTSKNRVWAGGDIATGAATVISAMGAGRRAAIDIDAYLRG